MNKIKPKQIKFLKTILKILDKRTKFLLFFTIGLSIISGFVEIIVLYFVGNLISEITTENLQIILKDLVLFTFTIILAAIIRIISTRLNAYSATEIVLKIGEATFMNTIKDSEYFTIDVSEAININSIIIDLLLSQVWIPLLQIILPHRSILELSHHQILNFQRNLKGKQILFLQKHFHWLLLSKHHHLHLHNYQ